MSALVLLQGSRTATADEWRLVQEFIAEQRLAAMLGLSVHALLSRETQRDLSTFVRIEALGRRNGWTFGSTTTPAGERGAINSRCM